MKTFREAVEFLDSFTDFEKKGFEDMKGALELSRLLKVLDAMARPDKAYRSIHVAGTKGKGSVCTFISSILSSSGYKTGLYTSPHMHTLRERIKIDGKDISEEAFAGTVSELGEYLGEFLGKFTYFEVMTLAAILYFKNEKVDFAVFETGLGGKLDATNVVEPEVAVLTPVSYDHMDILGHTLPEIAREKAAIIKKGSVCVTSDQSDKVKDVIKARCAETGSGLFEIGKDVTFRIKEKTPDGSVFDVMTGAAVYSDCRTDMAGAFQVENAAAALCACEIALGPQNIDAARVKEGISLAFIPGRLEVLSRDPAIVIDGAQNADSALKLKYSVEQIFKYDRLIILVGVSKDKDISGICAALRPLGGRFILTRSSSPRAMDPAMIRGYLKGKDVSVTGNVTEALGLALSEAGKNDLILATGSFYMIAEIRERVLGKRVGK